MTGAYHDTSPDRADSLAVNRRAVEIGVTVIDTAEVCTPAPRRDDVTRTPPRVA